MIKILIVEDDIQIVSALSQILTVEGFITDTATGKKQAMEKISSNSYDLILLDISLPDGNGFSICSAVRATTDTPVIFLTASSDEYSVVAGLNMGADDYIEKPYRPRELISRIRSVLRRSGKTQNIVSFGNVVVNIDKALVTKGGSEVFFSALEYRLFLLFVNNLGRVMSRQVLLSEIWDAGGDFVSDNALTVYIKRLREKIEDDPSNPKLITTIRGIGYMLSEG